jgi:phosphoribosylformylglycinamidine synthase
MTFTAQVDIMPLKELLDPQGKAVKGGLEKLGLTQINDIRNGKHLVLQVYAASSEEAHAIAEEACRKLLANPVMEYFEIHISE